MDYFSLLYIFLGLTLLVIGGEYLVRSSVALSFRLQLSKMVIGLTVVSFATSAPELLVSLGAALGGHSDISLGNVIGSNIANIGLVLGITAVIGAIRIDPDFFKLNWPVMVFLSFALYAMLLWGDDLNQMEGVVLLFLLGVYLYYLIRDARKNKKHLADAEDGVDPTLSKVSNFRIIVWLLIGGVALWGGSELLVDGAIQMAISLGVSERVIAVTMIAVGTSVPELAASVIAALKREKAISLGNLIGSNIFNIACVLGITSIIKPIQIQSEQVLTNDIFWMLAFAVVLLPLAFLPKRMQFTRYKGLIIVIAYAIFTSLAFQ